MLIRVVGDRLRQWGRSIRCSRRRCERHTRIRRRVFLEPLEPRLLLTLGYSLSGPTVEFQPAPELYLRVADGVLEHSTDGRDYQMVTSSDSQPLVVTETSRIVAAPGTTVFMTGMDQGGGTYEADNLILERDYVTNGQDLSFKALSIQVVAGAAEGKGFTFDTGSTAGPGGKITFEAYTIDVGAYSRFLSGSKAGSGGEIRFVTPNTNPYRGGRITIGDHTAINSQGAADQGDGHISFRAEDISYNPGIAIWEFLKTITGQVKHTAFVHLGAGVSIKGGQVTASAETGDTVLTKAGDDDPAWKKLVLNLGVSEFLLRYFNDLISLPVSVVVRDSDSSVTLGTGSTITSSQGVTLSSSSHSSAVGEASTWLPYFGFSAFSLAIGVSVANSRAETLVDSGATIVAAGDVEVTSTASTTAKTIAKTTQNTGTMPVPVNPNNVSVAVGTSVLNNTSHATVAEGAAIRGQQRVTVSATGRDTNSLTASTASSIDGRAGVAVGVAVTRADVRARVDGTIEAGFVPTLTSQVFNPFLAVDWVGHGIRFATDPGYRTGRELVSRVWWTGRRITRLSTRRSNCWRARRTIYCKWQPLAIRPWPWIRPPARPCPG